MGLVVLGAALTYGTSASQQEPLDARGDAPSYSRAAGVDPEVVTQRCMVARGFDVTIEDLRGSAVPAGAEPGRFIDTLYGPEGRSPEIDGQRALPPDVDGGSFADQWGCMAFGAARSTRSAVDESTPAFADPVEAATVWRSCMQDEGIDVESPDDLAELLEKQAMGLAKAHGLDQALPTPDRARAGDTRAADDAYRRALEQMEAPMLAADRSCLQAAGG